MSIASGTVAVNAAFLQEIKEDAREFRLLLAQAMELLSNRHTHHVEPKRLVELLGKLRDQLALHFTLEEAYGYFEDAIDIEPRLSERADMLRKQHQTLFADLCAIVETAEQLLYHEVHDHLRAKLGRLFHCFRADLELHEARESELIMGAFNDDIGCGD